MEATERDSITKALEFLGSMRGQYIMGQALQIAIESLESVEPEVRRELSNIQDMKFIRDELFPMGAAIASASKEVRKTDPLFDLRDVAEEAEALCPKCFPQDYMKLTKEQLDDLGLEGSGRRFYNGSTECICPKEDSE